jgi:peptide/nickel transport system substrate-binding protein
MKPDPSLKTADDSAPSDRDHPRLTRRTLLARAGATGLAALGAPALLAACTGPQTIPPTPTGAPARTGGRITWAVTTEPPGVDPHVVGSSTAYQFIYRVYDQLVTFDINGKVVPSVAASWTQPSSTNWVFKLRDNVKFSNGRSLRAVDVAKSFQRLFDPKIKSPFAARVAGPMKEVRAVDDLTVQFELQRPHGPFLPGLIATGGSILPMQELEAGTFDPSRDMLGSGPFLLKERLTGESWTFARNPYYWRPDLPKADELAVLIVPDTSARIAALRTGRADIAIFDNVDAPRLLGDVPNVKTVVQATSEFYNLIVNNVTPPTAALKDQRVRHALSLAVDRDQVIQIALGGNGKPVFGTIPGLPDDCDASRLPKRDLARARALLAEAGATGISFEIISNTSHAAGAPIAQVLQRQFAEVGINARLQTLEPGAWLKRLGVGIDGPAEFDMSVTFYGSGSDNWVGMTNWSAKESPFTAKFQKDDAAITSLLDKTRGASPGDRAADFQQLCGVLADTNASIPLATKFEAVAYRQESLDVKVQQFEPAADYVRFIPEFARKR